MTKLNPMEAYQKARISVLEILAKSDNGSWENLWRTAKAEGMNYNTFRKHMASLKKEGIVTMVVKEDALPAKVTYTFDIDRLNLETLYLEDILAFIDKKMGERSVSLDYSGWFVLTEKESFSTLFKVKNKQDYRESEKSFKDYLKMNALIAQIGLLLSKRKEERSLSEHPVEKQKILGSYKKALFDYVDLHFAESLLEGITNEDREAVKGIFTPGSFEDALKELDYFRKSDLREMRATWSEEHKDRKQVLEQFLKEHESEYKEFMKQVETNSKSKMVAILPIFGFRGGYPDKRNKLLRSLPPEISLPFLYEKGELPKKDLEQMKESIMTAKQKAGKHKIVFVCPTCFGVFKKEGSCIEHISRKHSLNKGIFPFRMSSGYYDRTLGIIRDLSQKSKA